MPVMGPNRDHAFAVGESAFTDIMMLLKSKYGVERPHEALPLGKKFAKEWDEMEAKLKELVKEMVWTDHASSF